MPVCAATRGPVCAAADTAPLLDSPRGSLGCQATLLPPVGAATRSNRRCALPTRSAPRRGTAGGTGAAALCPCHWFLPPLNPLGGLRIPPAPASARGGSPRSPAPLPRQGPLPLPRCKALHCTATGLLRQGRAARTAVLAHHGCRPLTCRASTHTCRREQGDAGGNHGSPVEWPVLFTCHSNPEKPPYACQTATRHLSR